jgi:hypothetical protein
MTTNPVDGEDDRNARTPESAVMDSSATSIAIEAIVSLLERSLVKR